MSTLFFLFIYHKPVTDAILFIQMEKYFHVISEKASFYYGIKNHIIQWRTKTLR